MERRRTVNLAQGNAGRARSAQDRYKQGERPFRFLRCRGADRERGQTGLRDVYTSTTVPLLLRQTYPTAPSFDKFVLAYSLVSSRAFQVDAFHSLALVPLADAFNHSDPPHVHFASEMWVCPECGKLDRCGHDEDGEVSARAADRVSPEEDDTCDMVVERAIQAGEEVFNTYGQLSNAKLLTSYGFLLEANERDTIEFALDEAAEACLPRIPSDPLVEQYEHLGTFSCLSTIEDNHPLLCTTDSAELSIDADARLSTSLWVMLVAAATLAAGGCSTKEMLRMTVAQLVDVVEVLAREQEAGEEEEPGKAERFAPSLDDVTIIQHIRQAVLRLCQAYRSRQHRAELGAADLLDLAEVRFPLPRTSWTWVWRRHSAADGLFGTRWTRMNRTNFGKEVSTGRDALRRRRARSCAPPLAEPTPPQHMPVAH